MDKWKRLLQHGANANRVATEDPRRTSSIINRIQKDTIQTKFGRTSIVWVPYTYDGTHYIVFMSMPAFDAGKSNNDVRQFIRLLPDDNKQTETSPDDQAITSYLQTRHDCGIGNCKFRKIVN
jgi:hypothetical protein